MLFIAVAIIPPKHFCACLQVLKVGISSTVYCRGKYCGFTMRLAIGNPNKIICFSVRRVETSNSMCLSKMSSPLSGHFLSSMSSSVNPALLCTAVILKLRIFTEHHVLSCLDCFSFTPQELAPRIPENVACLSSCSDTRALLHRLLLLIAVG
jgi:hypothetical protein